MAVFPNVKKDSCNSDKKNKSSSSSLSLPPLSLSLLFPARVAQGRGEEKRQRVTSPMASPSLLRATCALLEC